MGILDKLRGKHTPPPDDAFLGLRAQALAFRPAGEAAAAPLHGVLMETGRSRGSATLVCLGDGSVSLYLSSGGGVIGAGQHESVRDACLGMISWATPYATDFLGAAEPVEDPPLPRNGEVFFHLLCPRGPHTARCKEADLVAQRDPFSNLFVACNHVLTRLRLLREGPQSDG